MFNHSFKIKIFKDYLVLAVLIIVIAFIFSSLQIYHKYLQCIEEHKTKLIDSSHEMDKLVHLAFIDMRNLMYYKGQEIAREEEISSQKISEHLLAMGNSRIKKNEMGSVLEWINLENKLIADSIQGVLKKPSQVSDRQYLIECPHSPWSLILSAPIWSNTQSLIIPMGMGITDKNNQFVGIISGGISIQMLRHKIRQSVKGLSTNYIIVDSFQNVICHSLDEDKKNLGALVRQLFQGFNCILEGRCELDEPIKYKQIEFYSYQKTQDYPIYIFTGLDRNIMEREFYLSFIPRIIGITGFCLCGLFLLYIFWQKRINPIIELTKIASQIANGSTDIKFPVQTSSEIRKLAYSLEQIVSFIQDRSKRLLQYEDYRNGLNKSMENSHFRNTQLEEAQKQLEDILKTLKKTDMAQEEFVRQKNKEVYALLEETLDFSVALLNIERSHLDFPINPDHQMLFSQKIKDNINELKKIISD